METKQLFHVLQHKLELFTKDDYLKLLDSNYLVEYRDDLTYIFDFKRIKNNGNFITNENDYDDIHLVLKINQTEITSMICETSQFSEEFIEEFLKSEKFEMIKNILIHEYKQLKAKSETV